MIIFLASHNKGKIREFKAVLADLPITVLSVLDDQELVKRDIKIPASFQVEETGQTYQQNAKLKAVAYAQLVNLPTLADDSGLELNARPGFPGVNSDRWLAGNAEVRNQALLKLLNNLASRKAFFQTTLCLYIPKTNQAHFFSGKITGEIKKREAIGSNQGFGYDPIFIPDGYEQSFAELGIEIKNKISHRAKALEKFKEFLASYQAKEILSSK